jgi:hypothetical protein
VHSAQVPPRKLLFSTTMMSYPVFFREKKVLICAN